MEKNIKEVALEKLSLTSSQESLYELIRWLDLTCYGKSPESLPVQILARVVVATGKGLIEKRALKDDHPIAKTLQAAEAYSQTPSQAAFDRYFHAATASYPFGSGEGCYAVQELGYDRCEPGSGCTSGAGTLYQIAFEIGVEECGRLIAKEVLPWLKND